MPTLREFLQTLVPDADTAELERKASALWGTERMYIPRADSQNVVTKLMLRREVAGFAHRFGVKPVARRYGVAPNTVRAMMRVEGVGFKTRTSSARYMPEDAE